MAPWVEDLRENPLGKPSLGTPAIGPDQVRDPSFPRHSGLDTEHHLVVGFPKFPPLESSAHIDELFEERKHQLDPELISSDPPISFSPIYQETEVPPQSEQTALGEGATIGLSVSGVILTLALVLLIYCCWRR